MKLINLGWIGFGVFLGALGFASCSKADELWLTATVGSYHFNRDKDYNERNYGLGFELRDQTRWGWAGGFYDNSYNRTTFYGGPTYMVGQAGPAKLGACLCLATGYSHIVGFYPIPSVTFEGKQAGVNVVVAPSVVAVQLKWRFK